MGKRPRWWHWGIIIPLMLYRLMRERTYYISGTGTKNGERIWFKTTFITYGGVLPIKEIEDGVKREIGLEKAVIVFFHRVPNSMRKYITGNFPTKIQLEKEEQND